MSTITIARQDTARKITDALTLGGAAINLTGCTVTLAWRLKTGTLVVEKAATIVSEAGGTVEYQFVDGDTDLAGEYWLEWHVEFPGETRLTVPQDTPHTLIIREDLST